MDKQNWIEFHLEYNPPLDWQSLLAYLTWRTARGAEAVIDEHYLRSVCINNSSGLIDVSHDAKNNLLRVKMSRGLDAVKPSIVIKIRRLFDLDADPAQIAAHLGQLSSANPGLRVAGAFDTFELGVRAILGQLVSVKGACTLMSRYVAAFGEPYQSLDVSIIRFTPVAAQVVAANIDTIAAVVGVPKTRAKAIWHFANAVESNHLNLESVTNFDAVINELKQLPGIGDWTAHYIAMHALSWSDAFPAGDLALRRLLNQKAPSAMLAAAEAWRPWRAYAVMHLWKSLEIEDGSKL